MSKGVQIVVHCEIAVSSIDQQGFLESHKRSTQRWDTNKHQHELIDGEKIQLEEASSPRLIIQEQDA